MDATLPVAAEAAPQAGCELIRDIGDNIVRILGELHDLDDDLMRDPRFNGSRRKDQRRIKERLRRAELCAESWTDEDRAAARAAAETEAETRSRLTDEFIDQWERLGPRNFPAGDPEAMGEMYHLMRRYAAANKGRWHPREEACGLCLLARLGNALDWPLASWYVATWLLAAVAEGDYIQAEVLLQLVLEEPEVRIVALSNKPALLALIPITRGLIALKRDGDWDLAIECAEAARRNVGTDPRSIAVCRALTAQHEFLCAEIEAGALPPSALTHAAESFDLRPLIDGSLNWTPPERQLADGDDAPLMLEHDDDDPS